MLLPGFQSLDYVVKQAIDSQTNRESGSPYEEINRHLLYRGSFGRV